MDRAAGVRVVMVGLHLDPGRLVAFAAGVVVAAGWYRVRMAFFAADVHRSKGGAWVERAPACLSVLASPLQALARAADERERRIEEALGRERLRALELEAAVGRGEAAANVARSFLRDLEVAAASLEEVASGCDPGDGTAGRVAEVVAFLRLRAAGSEHPEWIEVGDLVAGLVGEREELAGRLRITTALPLVEAPRALLHHVFSELVDQTTSRPDARVEVRGSVESGVALVECVMEPPGHAPQASPFLVRAVAILGGDLAEIPGGFRLALPVRHVAGRPGVSDADRVVPRPADRR